MADAGEVQGFCNQQFARVGEVFQKNFDRGLEIGASVAVYKEGEPVVDLWGGWVDEAHSAPWGRDSITNVWSTTKTMTNLCALMLADHGEINLFAPVATYWPAFKANDKEAVEVRHLLSHTSGLSGWQEPLTTEDLYDWEKVTSLLAAQKPWWPPGTASGYHAFTQGYLVGEVVRRVTGQSLGTFFAQEVAGPLKADFQIGLPPDDDFRTVAGIPPESVPLDELPLNNELFVKTFTNPLLTPEMTYQEEWRRAEIPAANGHSNARGVAAVQSVLSNGGEARGTRLLSAQGCENVFVEQSNGVDLVLGIPIRFGMGYALSSEGIPLGERTCFWGGLGGSLVVSDLDSRVTFAYVMNRLETSMFGDMRGVALALATASSLKVDGSA